MQCVKGVLSEVKLKIDYYTDPLCAWSYVSEPTIQQTISQYGDKVDFRFRSLPIIDRLEGEPKAGLKVYRPEQIGREWREISAKTGRKIDPGLWEEHPPHSSWPANRAMKAALRQGFDKGNRFIHELRDAVMQQRRNPSNLDTLKEIAGRSGLDADRFYDDMTANATQLEQEVTDDRLEAIEHCINSTPTLVLQNEDGDKITIEGTLDFQVIQPAIRSLLGTPVEEPVPSI
jgi:predicted DsbA family dithiol-disulfide isomerase